jgi:hypothetical protein
LYRVVFSDNLEGCHWGVELRPFRAKAETTCDT